MADKTDRDGKFVISDDGERFSASEFYDTREAAIAAAHLEGIGAGDEFWTGRVRVLAVPLIDGQEILERMREHLHNECGEAADDGLECTFEQERELGHLLSRAAHEWMVTNGIEVGCFAVDDAQRHLAPDVPEEVAHG